MTVPLRSCKVNITLVPIGYDDAVLVSLTSKLAKGENLSHEDISKVKGFRFALNTQTRRTADASKRKAYLVLRITLSKDERPLKQIEVMDVMSASAETVIDHVMIIPRTIRNRLGEWTVKIGYCGLYEDEIIPETIKAVIESMPYKYTDDNQKSFTASNNVALATGERAQAINTYSQMRSGQNSPDDI